MRQLVSLLHNMSVRIYIMHSTEEIHLITPPSSYCTLNFIFRETFWLLL